jgi:prepilin-type N-terminal cleavage/methylation domain-containing protein
MKSFPPSSSVRRRRAFSLVEIMIAVTIIGILAMLALPAMARLKQSSQNSRFISDLRTFAQGFETFAAQNGGWPPNAGAGVVPTGMSGFIRDAQWSTTNSVGGRWNWDYNNFGVTASISTVNVTASDAQMTICDEKIDDGNLSTGRFQKNGTRFLFVLQE